MLQTMNERVMFTKQKGAGPPVVVGLRLEVDTVKAEDGVEAWEVKHVKLT